VCLVRPGQAPVVTVADNAVRELMARLIVCADGKSSMGRTWGGFTTRRGKQRLFGAGVICEEMAIADDAGVIVFNRNFLFSQDYRTRIIST
jgi:2-polyprenyl-6-methoxyphenol hydroxylase-like FAD-dependent oxidoreductase